MPMPVMTLANATATGDMIVGPGALTSMVKGRPVATIGAPVTGVSPIGVPVATVCAVTLNMNDIF